MLTGTQAEPCATGSGARISWRSLFLEEILEGLAGVVGARRRGRRGAIGGRLGIGSWRGVFFDGHAKFVESAGILCVFGGDAFGDRLGAFELRAGIEEAALLAAVQFELALGTRAVGIEAGGQHGAAIRASRACDRAHHAGRAGPKLLGATGPAGWGLAVVGLVLFFAFFRVTVSAVTVLSIHKGLRPPASADCHNYNHCFCAVALDNLVCIQSDCYTRPDRAIIPLRFLAELRTSESRRRDIYVCSPMGVRSQAGM